MSQIYGYARVSTIDQNEDRQLISLREGGVPLKNLFIEKQSGKDFNRPVWQKLMDKLEEGDLLIVISIDRLGRNYQDIMEQWRLITKVKNVDIKILDMPLLDTTSNKDLIGTFISDVVLQLLSFIAQNERENIRKRQAEGIAAAKIKGVKFGNRPKEKPEDFGIRMVQWERREITLEEFMECCNVKRSKLYEWIREYRGETG